MNITKTRRIVYALTQGFVFVGAITAADIISQEYINCASFNDADRDATEKLKSKKISDKILGGFKIAGLAASCGAVPVAVAGVVSIGAKEWLSIAHNAGYYAGKAVAKIIK